MYGLAQAMFDPREGDVVLVFVTDGKRVEVLVTSAGTADGWDSPPDEDPMTIFRDRIEWGLGPDGAGTDPKGMLKALGYNMPLMVFGSDEFDTYEEALVAARAKVDELNQAFTELPDNGTSHHDLGLSARGALHPAPFTEPIEDDPGPEVPWGQVDPTERHVFSPLSIVNPWDCAYCFAGEGALIHTDDMREQVVANYGDPSDELAQYEAYLATFDEPTIESLTVDRARAEASTDEAPVDAAEWRDVVLPGGRDYLRVVLAAHLAHALRDRLTRNIGLTPYYVQWAPGGPGLQVEVVSDRYLASEHQITAFGESRMRELGFAEPTADDPNWTIWLADEYESMTVAEPLVTALLDVYRLPMPEVIVAVGGLPDPALAPTAPVSPSANDSSSTALASQQQPESPERDETEARLTTSQPNLIKPERTDEENVRADDEASSSRHEEQLATGLFLLFSSHGPLLAASVLEERGCTTTFTDAADDEMREGWERQVDGTWAMSSDKTPTTVGETLRYNMLLPVAYEEFGSTDEAQARAAALVSAIPPLLAQDYTKPTALISPPEVPASTPGDDPSASGNGPKSATAPILTRPEPGESREEFKLRVAAALGVKPSQTLRGPVTDGADVGRRDSEDPLINAPQLDGAESNSTHVSDTTATKHASGTGTTPVTNAERLRTQAWQVERSLDGLVVDVDGWWEPWADEVHRGIEGIKLVQAPGRALATEITVSASPWRLEITTDLGEFLVHDDDLDELIPLDTRLVSVFVIPDTENANRDDEDPWRIHLGARCRIDLDAVQRSVPLRLLVDLTRRTSVSVLLKMQELCRHPGVPVWFGAPAAPDKTVLASWLTLPWPPRVDRELRASFGPTFDDAGFGVPWLPDLFAESLELNEEWWWSAREAAGTEILGQVDAYTFAPALDRLALDWAPRFHLSHFHGSINYEFVGRRLSALAQSWTGTYGRDPDDSIAGVRLLATDLNVLERLAETIDDWPSERGRLLVWGSFRGACGWRWLAEPEEGGRDFEDVHGEVEDLGTGLGSAIRMLEAMLADELGLPDFELASPVQYESHVDGGQEGTSTTETNGSTSSPVAADEVHPRVESPMASTDVPDRGGATPNSVVAAAAKTMFVYAMDAPRDLTTTRPDWAYIADEDLHNVYEFFGRGLTPGWLSALTADDLRPHPYFPPTDKLATFDLDKMLAIACSNHMGPSTGPFEHATLDDALAFVDGAFFPAREGPQVVGTPSPDAAIVADVESLGGGNRAPSPASLGIGFAGGDLALGIGGSDPAGPDHLTSTLVVVAVKLPEDPDALPHVEAFPRSRHFERLLGLGDRGSTEPDTAEYERARQRLNARLAERLRDTRREWLLTAKPTRDEFFEILTRRLALPEPMIVSEIPSAFSFDVYVAQARDQQAPPGLGVEVGDWDEVTRGLMGWLDRPFDAAYQVWDMASHPKLLAATVAVSFSTGRDSQPRVEVLPECSPGGYTYLFGKGAMAFGRDLTPESESRRRIVGLDIANGLRELRMGVSDQREDGRFRPRWLAGILADPTAFTVTEFDEPIDYDEFVSARSPQIPTVMQWREMIEASQARPRS